MSVRDLAPVLIAVNQLFETAAEVVYGKHLQTSVYVKSFEKGSFGIDLNVIQTLTQQLTNFFDGSSVNALLNLKEILFTAGASGVGLFIWLKKLKGRAITKVAPTKEGYEISVEGETFVISADVYRLSSDIRIRSCVETITKPLQQDGIEGFEVRERKETILTISKDEEKFLRADVNMGEEIPISEHEFDKHFTIVTLTFKEGNKWRLNDGSGTINAIFLDEEFVKRIDNSEIAFTKGDILFCRVRLKEYKTNGILKNEYEILRVLEHRTALKDSFLPF